MVAMSAALVACSFDGAWTQYCTHPGRCSKLDDDGGVIDVAQSTTRQIRLTGQYLFDASTVAVEPPVGTASIASSDDGQVLVDLTMNHGVAVDTPFRLRIGWERADDGLQTSPGLVVTPIWVTDVGRDDANGLGTPGASYATLVHASEVSGAGDTIRLGAGRFPGIFADAGCDPSAGLRAGVAVQGESRDASVVQGPGLCGFNLFDGQQAVRDLTIFGFQEGIHAGDGGASGGRPTVSDVTVMNCTDAGVAAAAGARLQLDNVELLANGFGLQVSGADVAMQGGAIRLSNRNGVAMTGNGGRLALGGVDVSANAPNDTGDPGAGISIGADGGKVLLDGGTRSRNNGTLIAGGNGGTSVAIAGASNEVTLDGAHQEGGAGIGLNVLDLDAGIFLRNSTIDSNQACIVVKGFRTFNGGTGDGGYGGSVLGCNVNISDLRLAGPPMTFERTQFTCCTPPAGTKVFPPGNTTYNIFLDGGTEVDFY
jgi:hypothetical protein